MLSYRTVAANHRWQHTVYLFYVAYGLYSFSCFLSYTTARFMFWIPADVFVETAKVISFVLLTLKVLSERPSPQECIAGIAILALGAAPWLSAGYDWLFWIAAFIVASKGTRIKWIALASLIASILVVSVSSVGLWTGNTYDLIGVRENIVRHAFGFDHYNALGYMLFLICTSVAVLEIDRSPLIPLMFLLLSSLFNAVFINSRTALIASICEAIVLFVAPHVISSRSRKIVSLILFIVLLLLIALSIVCMIAYRPDNRILVAIDNLMSGRISLSHYYYCLNPPSLFGQSYENMSIPSDSSIPLIYTVDNTYCSLLMRYGLVPSIVFLAGWFTVLVQSIRHERWDAIFFGLLIMGIYAVSETYPCRIDCNYFLVAMGTNILFEQHKRQTCHGFHQKAMHLQSNRCTSSR